MSNRLGGTLKAFARDAATVLGAVIAVSFFANTAMAGPDVGAPISVETETISSQVAVSNQKKQSGGAGIDVAFGAAASQLAGALAPIAKPVAAVFEARPTAQKIAESSPERTREIRCLAEAIYYEARGEPERGQLAVAEVVSNRVDSRAYPSTYCGVVRQRSKNVCQFSWACDSNRRAPVGAQWDRAMTLATRVVDGWKPGVVKGATHFHATRVNPNWAAVFPRVAQIGSHVFYRGK